MKWGLMVLNLDLEIPLRPGYAQAGIPFNEYTVIKQ